MRFGPPNLGRAAIEQVATGDLERPSFKVAFKAVGRTDLRVILDG